MSTTAMARVEEPAKPFALKSPIATLLNTDAARAVIMSYAPHGMNYEQLISEVYRAGVNDPKILQCTPASIINAVATVVQTGLTVGKTIYLVPQRVKVNDEYEERLQAWIDYRGDIELVIRSGAARFVDGHAVYANETYEVTLGLAPNVVHVPIMDEKKRGALIGGYAYAILPGRMVKVFAMTIGEVEEVRGKSRSWKHLPQAPAWYVIKSCIHRVTKTLPKNEKLRDVIALFDRQETEDADTPLTAPLDPAKQIAAPASTMVSDARMSETQQGSEAEGGSDRETSAGGGAGAPRGSGEGTPSSSDSRAPIRSGPSSYPLPFVMGAAKAGTVLGDVSSKDLNDAVRFADGVAKYELFVEMGNLELENRRLADEDEEAER